MALVATDGSKDILKIYEDQKIFLDQKLLWWKIYENQIWFR